ncbi:hypothetical protein [Pseudofrankia inefficax]|uniref:hypothetical protein n=1 Tax=Pseudofrankia inefficax (strain DSM 45817 / CECT 9037 / DDB 130130 / EuI1c) TaxID=298654 RepID=UPI0012FD3D84|nr:hypothetical protein [Pseudofrankia inefficax]
MLAIDVGTSFTTAASGGHDILAQAGITLIASDYYSDLIPALIELRRTVANTRSPATPSGTGESGRR